MRLIGNDAQDDGAGGVAFAVDDDPFAPVADGGVFELVLMDEAAVVLADAIVRERGASGSGDYASRAHDGEEEIRRMQPQDFMFAYSVDEYDRSFQGATERGLISAAISAFVGYLALWWDSPCPRCQTSMGEGPRRPVALSISPSTSSTQQ
jgi:hypothetical protein